ncbi:MAG TPA: 2-octaprenyl-6-methoxyphenyl hydroxylase [Rubrivivax sp.]|nr:2-octaprenyl-6-methoxyphenyl hydroxylase [Rubrivivax sp.]
MTAARTPGATELRIAVVGAGPVGLALALLAAGTLPHARISLFDRRDAAADAAGDARTLALALGSVQLLQRLGCWPAAQAQPIAEVQVSQAEGPGPLAGAELRIRAADEGVPMLGAVLRYGELVAPLQRAWLAAAARDPSRLTSRFGCAVRAIEPLPDGVALDTGSAERFDLAVVAEGGVYGQQARKALASDYGQSAWVGTATLHGGTPGLAVERFTRDGPVALLPLKPAAPAGAAVPAALVWCVQGAADPVRGLGDAARIDALNRLLPAAAGRVVALTPLKDFALGLNAERRLVVGRSVRIGNAAQTLHPVAGQGTNLGLRDAFELVEVLRREPDVDRALRRIERLRAPDRWSTIATTDFLARSFTWRVPGLGAARALGLAALQAAGPLRSRLARQMMFGTRL